MSLKEKRLTVDEVLRIVEGSCQANVTSLSFRGLLLTFVGGRPQWEPRPSVQTASAVATADEIDQQTTDHEEIAARETQAQELVITDPAQFEELMARGELVDDGNGQEGDPT